MLVGGIGHAQLYSRTVFDHDADGVCDESREELLTRADIDSSNLDDLGCRVTNSGDLCDATPIDERADSDGCSKSQKEGDYWSLELGQIKPKTVKLNWLTDQRRGVEVYVPITLRRNIVVGGIEENVNFQNMVVDCDGKGIRDGEEIQGGRDHVSGDRVLAGIKEDDRVVVQLRIRQLRDDEVDRRDIGNSEEFTGIDSIEVTCEAFTRSIVTVRGEEINNREVDEFRVNIPLDTIVFQPPDRFIEAGKDFAHGVAVTAGDWAGKVNKVVRATTIGCFSEGGLALLLWPFSEDAAKFIWYGPRVARGFPIVNAAPWSGRAMCSYVFCPADNCRALGVTSKTYIETGKDPKTGETVVTSRPISVRGELGDRTVHSDLILSTACGCVSGIEMNLRKIEVIAESWEACFEIAATTGEYINQCKEFLSQDVCRYVVGEFKDHVGVSLLKWVGRKIFERETPEVSASLEEEDIPEEVSRLRGEAAATERAREKAEDTIGGIRHFYDSELREFAGAYGRSRVGFTSERDLFAYYTCYLALYKKFPSFDAFGDFDKRLGVRWETTLSGNVESYVAYIAEDIGRPVYGYTVSWSIIAGDVGRQTFTYRVYLRGPSGTRNVDEGKSGILRNPGDIERSYIEITDSNVYDEICFEVTQKPLTCFAVGERFSEGGPFSGDPFSYIADFFWEDETDSDKDRLPDWWENRFNCDVSDRDFCGDLNPDKGEENKLNPNNANSDGDRIEDDEEDPDEDGFNNYQEYKGRTHPNIADIEQAEGTRFFSCNVDVKGITVSGGRDRGIGLKVFEPGDLITVRLNEARLLEGTAEPENVMVKLELKNVDTREVHFQGTELISLDQIQGGGLLELIIDDDAPSGTYKVEAIIGLSTGLSLDKCGSARGEELNLEEQIIVHNREDGGCIDTDKGEFSNIAGYCMDSSGLKVDRCNSREHQEWVCERGRCSSKLSSCNDDEFYCGNGVCIQSCFDNDPEDSIAAYGACRSFTYDPSRGAIIEDETMFDECVDDKSLVEYSCSSGGCVAEQTTLCPNGASCYICNVPIEFAEGIISERNDVGVCAATIPDRNKCEVGETVQEGVAIPV